MQKVDKPQEPSNDKSQSLQSSSQLQFLLLQDQNLQALQISDFP